VELDKPLLHTFACSHYCERARWGLQVKKIDFEEVQHVAGFHKQTIFQMTGKPTLPVLQFDKSDALKNQPKTLSGSGTILDWCMGASPDAQFEQRCEVDLGRLVRQFTYAASLRQPSSKIKEMLLCGGPRWQLNTLKLAWPLIIPVMEKQMDAYASKLPVIGAELEVLLNAVNARLGSRSYFDQAGFSRVDITVASLIAPLARPTQMPLYQSVQFLPQAQPWVDRWVTLPLMEWARNIYNQHR
jgi:glutathione S-transferase